MKTTVASILVATTLIGGAIIFSGRSNNSSESKAIHTVSVIDGKQVIEIKAKGGYQPRKSVAKAGIPTILRFNTSGTFDCSSVVRIPSMNISKTLPQTGQTDIDLGSPEVATLQGTCGMGMYPFEISFI